MKEGPNCQRAIEILNYIGWINGSKFRIPKTAQFDMVRQVIEENKTLDDSNIGRLRY